MITHFVHFMHLMPIVAVVFALAVFFLRLSGLLEIRRRRWYAPLSIGLVLLSLPVAFGVVTPPSEIQYGLNVLLICILMSAAIVLCPAPGNSPESLRKRG